MIHYRGPVEFVYEHDGPSDEVHVVISTCTCCYLSDPDFHRLDLPRIGEAIWGERVSVEVDDPSGTEVTTERVMQAVERAKEITEGCVDASVRVDPSGFEVVVRWSEDEVETHRHGREVTP